MASLYRSIALVCVLILAVGCGAAQSSEPVAEQPTLPPTKPLPVATVTSPATDTATPKATARATATAPATPTAIATSPPPTAAPLETLAPTVTSPAPPTPDPRCAFPSTPWDVSAVFPDLEHESDFWKTSSPEEQGIDSQLLEQGMALLAESPGVYSYLLVRNGHIVLERYFNGSSQADSRDISSVSESIISALLGIAIREGHINSPHVRVSDILPDYFAAEANWPKKTIKLQALLTQTEGLVWDDSRLAEQVEREGDWVQAMIDMELSPFPGYHYNTGTTHILSAVLASAMPAAADSADTGGMTTCDLAYRYLFDPLDISPEYWGQDPQGVFVGGWNMFLTPREMAKFGLLYLNDGQWQGEQIVPAEWVAESLSAQTDFGPEYDYGYLWWLGTIDDYAVYSAIGHGGQEIHIIPELDMVIVTTGDVLANAPDSYNSAGQYYLPRIPEVHGGIFFTTDSYSFIRQHILPAVLSKDSG